MKDSGLWAEAAAVASRMRTSVRSVREIYDGEVIVDFELLDNKIFVFDRYIGEIVDSIHQDLNILENTLNDAEFDLPRIQLNPHETWSLGTLDLSRAPVGIYRGYLRPTFRVMIAEPPSQQVIAFLIAIDGDDLLKREHHSNFGWHYHYLDWKKRRSDIILCWDGRAILQPTQQRALFSEYHSENNSDFTAKTHLWGEKKKHSMHAACAPDLTKWPLEEFKFPKKNASAVWPINAALTSASKPTSPTAVQIKVHQKDQPSINSNSERRNIKQR